MYTVLLVDDEPTILDALKNSINWQQFGVSSLLSASDGLQAMETLSQNSVDLLITDIKMPHMDGLSLLKSVRTLYPDTHCILLSAYSEFEYARQAIHLGAENYLLKPLQKAEVEESIGRALDNIYTNRNNSQHLFRNNIFTRWVKGTITGSELADRATLLNINLFFPEYCALILYKKQASLSLSSYCQACVRQLEGAYDVHHFKDDNGNHVFIVGGSQIVSSPLITCFADEASRSGLSHLLALSIGTTVPNAESLPRSYQMAHSQLEGANLSMLQDSPATGITVLMENPNTEHDENRLTQHLNILFQNQDNEIALEKFQALADDLIRKTQNQSISSVKTLLCHSLFHLFAQEFPNYPKAQEQLNNRIRMFKASSDTDTNRAGIIDLMEYGYLLFRYYTNILHPIVQSATQYIHNHYSESISIQEFCNLNKVSAPYLGYLFKRETGFFFNTYLTQYRVCRSIPLLLDSDLKINDIASQVGFSSANYYITCFKQQTGLSPTKYRVQSR